MELQLPSHYDGIKNHSIGYLIPEPKGEGNKSKTGILVVMKVLAR